MSWKETSVITLREEFVLRALEPNANLSAICREYGISRKTGYKWLSRFKTSGRDGLCDRSTRPLSSPSSVTGEIVLRIIEIRRDHRRWGPKKIRVVLLREHTLDEVPCVRTIGRILKRAGLSRPPRRRVAVRSIAVGAPDTATQKPHDLWTIDFNGQWTTQDGSTVEPLTVRDHHSKFVLEARILPSRSADHVRAAMEAVFREHGLPRSILVDNGTPFISTRARGGLTRLSAWWVALGIRLLRNRPAKPQDNGAHERMHLEIANEVEKRAGKNPADCQQLLDRWRIEFNNVRPHERLDGAVPAAQYRRSSRRLTSELEPLPREGYVLRKLTKKGFLSHQRRQFYVSEGLIGRRIHVKRLNENAAHLRYYDIDLGDMTLPEYTSPP